jgi:hypothetical protein
VTRPTQPAASPKPEPQRYVLSRNEGNEATFLTPQTFADVAIAEIRELDSMDALYAFAKRNKGTFVHRRRVGPGMRVLMDTIGLAISARAQVLRRRRNAETTAARDQATPQSRPAGWHRQKKGGSETRSIPTKQIQQMSEDRDKSSSMDRPGASGRLPYLACATNMGHGAQLPARAAMGRTREKG